MGVSPGGSPGQECACNAGDWIPSLDQKDPPGEGNGNPLRYSCLEKPVDREAWWATVPGVQRVGHDWVTNNFTFKRILVFEMGGGRKCSFNTDNLRSVALEPQSQLLTYKVGSFTATNSSMSWWRGRTIRQGADSIIVSVGRRNF